MSASSQDSEQSPATARRNALKVEVVAGRIRHRDPVTPLHCPLAMKSLLAAIILCTTIDTARADPVIVETAFFSGAAANLAFGLHDIFGHPTSKVYGGVELGVGLSTAVLNFAVASVIDGECGNCNVAFYGMGALNTAIAIHGIYLLAHHESSAPPPLSFELGSVRAHVVPTTVGSGLSATAGLGLSGTF
jgi:hypothetical protein